jgi:two-component system, NtrC family, response regulator AtoC
MSRVCLIEDDPIMGEALVQRLELEGFAVVWHRTGRDGMGALAAGRADLAVIDVNLPDLSGADLFARLLEERVCLPPSLFITGYGTIEDAVRLLKLGAADYLTKPLDPTALIEKLRTLAGSSGTHGDASGDDPLGVSPTMRHLAAELARMARHSETPVLICGESGVGKEVVARHLHRLQCPDAPFVAVNCAALPETLIEAELFGHEKGAFTGAERRRAGVFEQAGRGILFLDEIGDMPLALQSRLLRVVQGRRLTRIGGSEPVEVAARLVCATHRNLAALVREGRFREDLFYRVRVLEIEIPPLRERPEDILRLAERFVAAYGRRVPQERRVLTAGDRERLLQHSWPGNVRELQHTLERACILGQGERLALDVARDLPPEMGLKAQAQASERSAIEAALAEQDFNMTATAARLGISRKTLWQKMKRYGVTRPG